MTMKNNLLATTAALMIAASPSMASEASDAIAAALVADNYTNIEVKVGLLRIKVEAYKDGVKIERTYSPDGTLRKEEIVEDGVETETHYDSDGKVVKTEIHDVDADEEEDEDEENDEDEEDDHDEDDDVDDDDEDDDEDDDDEDDDDDDEDDDEKDD